MSTRKYFGIDLGTYSCIVSTLEKSNDNINIKIVKNKNSEFTKSIVAIKDFNNVKVGEVDLNSLKISFSRTKGKLGTQRSVRVNNKNTSIQFCAALILKYLRNLDKNMNYAVVTIPTFYNQSMRNSTIEAAKQAGFVEVKLIEEPTSAAMYHIYKQYTLNKNEFIIKNRRVLVFDIGGGTTDLSLIEFTMDNRNNINPEVLKIEGEDNLGGYLIDILFARKLIELASSNIRNEKLIQAYEVINNYVNSYLDKNNDEIYGSDNEINEIIYEFLKAAEYIKIKLSENDIANISIDNFINNEVITREEFEEIILEEEMVLKKIEDLLKKFKIANQGNIDDVILVGGTSKIPKIREVVNEVFTNSNYVSDDDYINAVSKGAAIISALNLGESIAPFGENMCTGVIPRDIFMKFNGEEFLILKAGLPYPLEKPIEQIIRIPFSLSEYLHINIYERDERNMYKVSDTRFYHPCFFTGDEIIFQSDIDENGMLVFKGVHKDTGEKIEFASKRENSLSEKQIVNGRNHIMNNVIFEE